DPSGIYDVPSTLGIHEFTFTASDADIDRLGDCLNTTITVSINITDDDILSPVITYIYTGNYTDGDPGQLIVNASDNSGLTLDPSGIYDVPSTLGIHEFTFTASDADVDRLGDYLNTTITVWINITDDDDEGPLIIDVDIINNRVYDYYEFIIIVISVEDASGISDLFIEVNDTRYYDDDRDNQILIENPRLLEIFNYFTVVAIDADNDREEDQKVSELICSFEVFDDDSTPPEIHFYYEDFSYQLSIVDNDGIEDSKATGEFFLIDEQGIILQSGVILLEDVNYTINIPLKPGNYCLEVYTTNNDRDFEGDEEYNNEIFRISVDLENCFLRVDKLLGDLIDYVDENLYFIIANSIGFKLCFARQDLWQAYLLVEAGDLNKGVFNELIIQAIIEFVEFETEFYNKIDLISTAIIDDMISFLHQIRNFVVLMMGNSVDYVKGISCGYDIASIEVELLNLEDFIEEQLGDCNCKYLEHLIKLSAMQLELAIIKLSRDINPDSALSLAKQFIDRAREETLDLLENNKISVDISSILLDSLNNCYSKIEELDLNNS
ncbi:MAG: Ig domain-containing protein, partial [Promethearchaeota archaeon]